MNLSRQLLVNWVGQYTPYIALTIVLIYGALASPFFLTSANLSTILYQYSIIGFLALGQLLVVITGGFDLSQGSLLALTSITTAVFMTVLDPFMAATGAVLITTSLGMVSGLLVSRTNMPSFIVTLGMLGIGRGFAYLLANAKPVSINHEGFNRIGNSEFLGIPVSAYLLGVACLIVYILLSRFRLGRYIYATGSNEENTRLSGVNVRTVKLSVYVLSSLLTAIGGVLWTSRLGSGSPIGGVNYELEAIAIIVIGGARLLGGKGTVSGVIAGLLIFGAINSILNLSGIDPFWQGTIKGLLLLTAVALSQLSFGKK